MKKIISFIFIIGMSLLFAQPVFAVNNLQKMIDDTPENGELKLEGKTYEGNIIINKPLQLIGEKGTIIKGDGNGNVIEIAASNVLLDTLDIRHSGKSRDSREEHSGVRVIGNHTVLQNLMISDVYHGIFLNRINDTTISNVYISGHEVDSLGEQGNGIHIARSSDNVIENSYIEKARDGVFIEYSNNNEIINNIVTETRYGLHYMYSNNNYFEGNEFINNTGGAAIMHSDHILLENNHFSFNQGTRSFGLLIQTSRDIDVYHNEFHLNQRGLYLEQSTNNKIKGNEFFHNQIGVELWTSSTAHVFTENVFNKNSTDVLTIGGESNNEWFENGKGNEWGKPLIDLNQDGIGDTVFESRSSLATLIEENELAYLFLNSPAITIYEKTNELVGNADIMAEDHYPLMGEKKGFNLPAFLVVMLIGVVLVKVRRKKHEERL